ncbi:MAG TPA: Glu/Leu/Phe/Val dehydrogenase [Bacteroidia bacterium]|nr:Glu/Leu/Phe/Val dehydrogenase [Bacteroidia bacterium]
MLEVKEMKETGVKTNTVFGPMSMEQHEQVTFCYDQETGLKAIIAVHNTVLGPALGGTRMWMYKSEAEALNDVLRLSRGMTLKAAVSGLNLGGGKAVIIGDSKKDKTEALFRKFGRFVNNLNGKYITAEDVGTSTREMEYVAMETKHVTGLPESMGGGGDPSPVTAYGVYMGMKAAAKEAYGSDDLENKRIVVQGVGHVGESLVKDLRKENAKVFITDINDDQLRKVAAETGAEVISSDAVYSMNMDIYAPCALGATLNSENIGQLKCTVIAGAANNQLADETIHGKMLMEKGIVYAPDFLINAGGLINVYSEFKGGYNRQRAITQTEKIYDLTLSIIRKSRQDDIPTYLAAKQIAEKRLSDISKVKSTY